MSDLGSEDVREALSALRDLLVARISDAVPGETAALAKQLADVILKIDSLPSVEKSELDDLEAKRAKRRSAAV